MEGLSIRHDGIYVDVTFGGGGHSRAILERLGENGKLFGFDQDEAAVANAIADSRFTLVKQNFRYLKNFLKLYNAVPVDGILADLGVSSHQFDTAGRGFSTRFEGPLDMRMNSRSGATAADVLNSYEEGKLKRMFGEFGEVENAGRLARTIVQARAEKPLQTIAELKQAIEPCVRKGKENQYYAQVFQALRIEVNGELDALKEMLMQAVEVLKPGGRLVVISYHSLEDRLVKHFMQKGKFEGEVEKDFYGNMIRPLEPLTRKPILPQEEEIQENNRARSAKLRIAQKSEGGYDKKHD
ncbi:MAG: S-adenosyl-methyltransferase MraW [Bacteroidetes bacterium]|nr:MAG: S-adenosyl-methyltransferase MraW [Bacteroidota bacterium]